MTPETRTCQNCKKDFLIEEVDFDFYEKIKVPPPTFCPECRMIRRLSFLNRSNLYHRKEAVGGKEILATYPAEADVVVYERDYWWSDAWDPMEYGRDVDFSRPFLEQVQELNRIVPWPSRAVQRMVNSDYCNQATGDKNCYLCFDGNNSEDCMYGVGFTKMKNCLDFYQSDNSQLSYELFWSASCYECFYVMNSYACRDVWFSRDCRNCQNCIGCVGLRNKQYYILNRPYSKENYEKKVQELNLGSYTAWRALYEQFFELQKRIPVKYMHGRKNITAFGDYIYGTKNVRRSFEVVDAENIAYSQTIAWNTKDSYDYTSWGLNSELIYESVSVGENCRNVKFSFDCWPACSDMEYCLNCHSSSNLFGCVGLKKKEYCILNKQYSKEDYLELHTKIIEHMSAMPYRDRMGREYRYGEMFPSEFSPLAYTETAAHEDFPVSKEEATRQGFLWREPSPREFQITVSSDDLPDHIHDTSVAITREIIGCVQCHRAYRILPAEFAFYKKYEIPLPRFCFPCRHTKRLRLRNPFRLRHAQCQCAGKKSENGIYQNQSPHFHGDSKCPNEFETSYAPDRPDIVYCEACYQAEVV